MQLLAGAAAFVNARRFLSLAFPCRRVRHAMPFEANDAVPSRTRSRLLLRSHESFRRPDAPRYRAPQHARVSIPGRPG
jgi:hypothetical protein